MIAENGVLRGAAEEDFLESPWKEVLDSGVVRSVREAAEESSKSATADVGAAGFLEDWTWEDE